MNEQDRGGAGNAATAAMPSTSRHSTLRSIRSFVLRASISAALLVLMLWAYDWRHIVGKLWHLSPGFIVFAWAFYAICQYLSAWRWKILLRAKGVDLSTGSLFVFYMIGMFANNFMPGGLGGDAFKAYSVYRRSGAGTIAVASVFVERFCGLIALSFLGTVACVMLLANGDKQPVVLWMLAVTLAIASMAAIVWSIRISGILRVVLNRLTPRVVRERALELLDTIHSYRNDGPALSQALAVSVVVQGLIATFYSLVGLALTAPVAIIDFLLFLPSVTLITLMPISLGGLGLREVAMVYLFGMAGVSCADILSISLTVHVLNTAVSLSGGLMLLISRFPRRGASVRPAP